MRLTEYIIGNENGMYLYYDNFRKLCGTDKIERAASFPTSGKAHNILTCSFPKKKRAGWKVIERITEDKPEAIPKQEKVQNISVQVCDGVQRYRSDVSSLPDTQDKLDWDTISKNFKKAYTDVVTYKEEIYKQLTDVELELCDCEHACEFFRYNAAKGYKLYSMIRDRRIKRRYLKNEYKKAMTVLNMSYQNIVDGKLERVFKEIDEQSYEPRVLTNLFEI